MSTTVEISVFLQELSLFCDQIKINSWPISTGKAGVGFENGSGKTPLGKFRSYARFGDGLSAGVIFESRKAVATLEGFPNEKDLPVFTNNLEKDLILSRIIWLEGVEEQNLNTKERYIYIHGTHRVDLLGTPASHGCVRMSPEAIIQLYAATDSETEFVIFE